MSDPELERIFSRIADRAVAKALMSPPKVPTEPQTSQQLTLSLLQVWITTDQCAKFLGITRCGARYRLKNLEKLGLVESRRKPRWRHVGQVPTEWRAK